MKVTSKGFFGKKSSLVLYFQDQAKLSRRLFIVFSVISSELDRKEIWWLHYNINYLLLR